MARVLAVLKRWGPSRPWKTWQAALTDGVLEILHGAIAAQTEAGFAPTEPHAGLLRNYLDREEARGDAAGTALMAAMVYR